MRPLGIVQCYKENNEATRQRDVIFYYLPKSPTNIQLGKKKENDTKISLWIVCQYEAMLLQFSHGGETQSLLIITEQ